MGNAQSTAPVAGPGGAGPGDCINAQDELDGSSSTSTNHTNASTGYDGSSAVRTRPSRSPSRARAAAAPGLDPGTAPAASDAKTELGRNWTRMVENGIGLMDENTTAANEVVNHLFPDGAEESPVPGPRGQGGGFQKEYVLMTCSPINGDGELQSNMVVRSPNGALLIDVGSDDVDRDGLRKMSAGRLSPRTGARRLPEVSAFYF